MKYRTGKCNDCNNKALYAEQYDVHYCLICEQYLENKCSDKTCQFCTKRPDNVKELGVI